MGQFTHLSLFTGLGGLDLAAEWAGFTTVGQCEWADYPTKVLEKHWPGIPRWRDIRTLTGGDFYERTGLRTVDVISGGFPCQPFSLAGKRRGKDDDRYLWPEMLRVIEDLQPTWVIGENVAGIVNMALDTVLSDLEDKGYETRTFIIPACGVDAPHQRYRTAILAHAKCTEWGTSESHRNEPDRKDARWAQAASGFRASSEDGRSWFMADTTLKGERRLSVQPGESRQTRADTFWGGQDVADAQSTELSWERTEAWRRRPELGCGGWWATEPDVGRVAHGVPSRVDRLRCLGNAVVPQQFYPIFKAIIDIEKQTTI